MCETTFPNLTDPNETQRPPSSSLLENSGTWWLFATGLPDGLFAYQKSQFGNVFEGFGIENVGVCYSQRVFLYPFGMIYGQ
jgi:hypothetical protein